MKAKSLYVIITIFLLCIFCIGCGETVRGVGKDARRIGQGTKTIFVSEE